MIDQVSLALIRLALQEDLAGFGDVTTEFTVPVSTSARGTIGAREELVASGLPLAAAVLHEVDPNAVFVSVAQEGTMMAAGSILAEVEGSARSLLMAERTMLNLLARLCAVATQSRRFADAVAGTGAVVIDTRKTTPGLRFWEKRAVRHGGCGNHRFGLFDMVLIKDNHLAAGGSPAAGGGVGRAVSAARAQASLGMKIEVEVTTEEGLRAAIAAGADVVMLDNIAARRVAATGRHRPRPATGAVAGGLGHRSHRHGARGGRDRGRPHLHERSDGGRSPGRHRARFRVGGAVEDRSLGHQNAPAGAIRRPRSRT